MSREGFGEKHFILKKFTEREGDVSELLRKSGQQEIRFSRFDEGLVRLRIFGVPLIHLCCLELRNRLAVTIQIPSNPLKISIIPSLDNM